MKASEANLLAFLKKSPQFTIPIYQRTYSWTEAQCQQLWDDIIRAGSSDSTVAHFIGSIVYIESGLFHVSDQDPLLVIDGQQRLTSVSLLIEALARRLGDSELIDGFSSVKLRHYYLINHLEEEKQKYKLLLTQTDEETLLALMDQAPEPAEPSLRIRASFDFFVEKIRGLGDDILVLCRGLKKLMVVDISLSRAHDNPQLIFESMNATGLELSQADLIRNYVLMGLEPSKQEELYRKHWRPMEQEFGQAAYGQYFDSFMRHYLIFRSGEMPNVRQVYSAFKSYSRRAEIAELGLNALVADLHTCAGYYCAFALGKESDSKLAKAFSDLRDLKVDVAYPLVLELYADYMNDLLSTDDFVETVQLIESYVFRRAVCGIPTNSLNMTFAQFGRSLKKDDYLQSIKANFLRLPSYRRFPNDSEFKEDIKVRDLYNFRSRSYWLRKVENHGRKEPVPVQEYTVEHILPQNENLSETWRNSLGSNWMEVRQKYLHSLGNLTLTGYNTEYSDSPFLIKRDMEGGFKESPLRVNKGLAEIDEWNENAICERASVLAEIAVSVWKGPQLEEGNLEAFNKENGDVSCMYSLKDHPSVSNGGSMHSLFELVRTELLALDPCVSEEILKLYIAYKAETNFVDIVPQASRLLLSLNMQFQELQDSRGMAKDVTNLGRWGNGDVEIGLAMPEDLPYVMSLVRQALERQLGDQVSQD